MIRAVGNALVVVAGILALLLPFLVIFPIFPHGCHACGYPDFKVWLHAPRRGERCPRCGYREEEPG